MSMCVFFPHRGIAHRGSHSARPLQVTAEMWTWPTSKPLMDTNWSGRVQVNVAVWGMRASIHGREELENVAECQLVTPEQLQEVAA